MSEQTTERESLRMAKSLYEELIGCRMVTKELCEEYRRLGTEEDANTIHRISMGLWGLAVHARELVKQLEKEGAK